MNVRNSKRRRILAGLTVAAMAHFLSQTTVLAEAENSPAQTTILFLGDSITRAGGYIRAIDAEKPLSCPQDSTAGFHHKPR
jgi:hypothetical protein